MAATAEGKRHKRLATMLAAAVAHPIRVEVLAVTAEREASPAEVARELGIEVSTINYHVQTLREHNLIEEVRTRPVRGALEHFYRAIDLPQVTDDQGSEMTKEEWRSFIEMILSLHAANASYALERGTLLARDDFHVTRTAMQVDQQGWEEATTTYMECFDRIHDIRVEAAERMGASGETPIRILSFLSLFELPAAELAVQSEAE